MFSTFCLALVIYVEARGEPLDGQYMVADVVMNRVAEGRWPDNVCDVVFDPKQFSGINNKLDLEVIFADPAWETSSVVASEAMSGNTLGSDATHFHTTTSRPYWSNHLTLLGQYGNHIFYREEQ
jgi:spore germination cell wall hydrolase CwlJ-like protein